MAYQAAENRYQTMEYRRCGQSGLKLPIVSLGLWHNFGDTTQVENSRALLQRAFDLGSPILIWRITMVHRRVQRSEILVASCRKIFYRGEMS